MPGVRAVRVLAPLIIGCAIAFPCAYAADGPPQVKEYDDGWYKQTFKPAGIAYLVDSIGRACFALTSAGMTEINCKSLKRRPEWNAVIDWEKRLKGSY